MAATYSEIRGYCIGLRFLFMPGAEMPSRLGLTIAGSWCPAHLKTIRFQLSKITNCFISSKTFPPLFVIKISESIHMPVPAMRARRRYTYLYICADIGRRKLCKMPFFFALLAFGFYCYHELKYYCAKTFDDVILDLRVEAPASVESMESNARHAVWYVDAGQ